MVVRGPAGIGKTRLLEAACATAQSAGARVLWAAGAESEQHLPFGCVVELFRDSGPTPSCWLDDELFSGAASLARPLVDPYAESRSGLPSDPSFALLHGLYWLCHHLADRSPLVLVVDDVHWADEASVRFLGFLARRIDALPVLILIGQRDSETPMSEALAVLSGEIEMPVVEPGALGRDAASRLVRAALGVGAQDAFCAACHTATGGNPLLLEQLLVELVADDLAPLADNARRVAEYGPPAVARLVLTRLRRLGPHAVWVAKAVAVLGSDATNTLVGALANASASDVDVTAGTLAAAGIFASGAPPRFAHPVVRTAVQSSLERHERARLHAAAAQALADRGAPAERVANHLLDANPGEEPWRVQTLVNAAHAATCKGLPDLAVAYLRRALEEPPAASERAIVLRELGLTLQRLGQDESAPVLEEALTLLGDEDEHAETVIALAQAHLGQGALQPGRRAARQARGTTAQTGPRPILARGS
jgi:tetratricopeptide (TPR) repeat protein